MNNGTLWNRFWQRHTCHCYWHPLSLFDYPSWSPPSLHKVIYTATLCGEGSTSKGVHSSRAFVAKKKKNCMNKGDNINRVFLEIKYRCTHGRPMARRQRTTCLCPTQFPGWADISACWWSNVQVSGHMKNKSTQLRPMHMLRHHMQSLTQPPYSMVPLRWWSCSKLPAPLYLSMMHPWSGLGLQNKQQATCLVLG